MNKKDTLSKGIGKGQRGGVWGCSPGGVIMEGG